MCVLCVVWLVISSVVLRILACSAGSPKYCTTCRNIQPYYMLNKYLMGIIQWNLP